MYNGPVIRPDPAKINKGRRRKIHILMVMDEIEDRINRLPTRGQLVPTEHDLNYQCVYVFCCYIYQNNWILIVVVIFLFV
jgi:hypothetical protein